MLTSVVVVLGVALSASAPLSRVADTKNQPPLAAAQRFEGKEDEPLSGKVQASDPEGQPLRFRIQRRAPTIKVNLNDDGTFTAEAPKDRALSETFVVQVSDGKAQTPTEVTLTFVAVNDAPTVRSVPTMKVNEDSTAEVKLVASDVDEADVLTFAIEKPPALGTANIDSSGALRFVATQDKFGDDVVVVVVKDRAGAAVSISVPVRIQAQNDAPVAAAQAFEVAEDATLNAVLVASDVDGDKLRFNVVTKPKHGSVSFGGDKPGAFAFKPVLDFFGDDAFVVEVSDGKASVRVDARVAIQPQNDAPVCSASGVTLKEDMPGDQALTATDADGDTVSFAIVESLSGVGASVHAKTLHLAPAPNYFGDSVVKLVGKDGKGGICDVAVAVKVAADNDAPVIKPQSFDVVEDAVLDATVVATDVDADRLRFTAASKPKHGTVTFSGEKPGVFSYRPERDFFGDDGFTVEVSDGKVQQRADVRLMIKSQNDAPVCSPVSVSLKEDTASNAALVATDVDGDPITFAIVDARNDLGASVLGSTLSIKPLTDMNGTSVVRLSAKDGKGGACEVVASVSVSPENDAPVLPAQSFTTREDQPLSASLPATDVDNDKLRFSLVERPKHGEWRFVEGTPGGFQFQPAKDVHGFDQATVEVSDGKASIRIAVTLMVEAQNDLPVCSSKSLTTNEDTAATADITASDVDGDVVKFSITAPSATVDAKVDGTKLFVTPLKDRFGDTTVTLKGEDGHGGQCNVVQAIKVVAQNDAPVVSPLSGRTDEDVAFVGKLTASDVDGDVLSFRVVKAPASGKLKLDEKTGDLRFEPQGNASGEVVFEWEVRDGKASTKSTGTLVVAPVNDVPVLADVKVAGGEDQTLTGQFAATDADADVLTYRVAEKPAHGELKVDAKTGAATYVPTRDYFGKDQALVEVADPKGGKASARLLIDLTPVNDAPVVAKELTSKFAEDSVLAETLQLSDVDGDALNVRLAKAAPHVSCEVTDAKLGSFRCTPQANWFGSEVVTFEVSDGKAVVRQERTLQVASVNDVPTVEPLLMQTIEDAPMAAKVVAKDLDNDVLQYAVAQKSQNGTFKIDTNGAVSYAPHADWFGNDKATVTVKDGKGGSVDLVVQVQVAPVNDAPVAESTTQVGNEDVKLTGSLKTFDVDGDALTYRIIKPTTHAQTTIPVASSPAFEVVPVLDFHGDDEFVFEVSDGKRQAVASVKLSFRPVNDAPVFRALSFTTTEDTPYKAQLSASDVDGDKLTYALVSNGKLGQATIDAATGALAYGPALNSNGNDTVAVAVSDGHGGSAQLTVGIIITPVNDAPLATDAFASTDEDTELVGRLAGSDVDKDALSFAIVTPARRGQATLVNPQTGEFKYLPQQNVHGEDSIGFEVSDGRLRGRGTIKITVNSVNDVPVLSLTSCNTREDTAATCRASATDADNDKLTFTVGEAAAHGDVVVDAVSGAIRYMPTADYNGADAFTMLVSDGQARADKRLDVTIQPVPDAPRVRTEVFTLSEDTPTDGLLPASDPDGEVLTFSLPTEPKTNLQRGAVEMLDKTAGRVKFLPTENKHGPDTIAFVVTDGVHKVNGTLPVVIEPVNDAPTAQTTMAKTVEETPVEVVVALADVDGDALKVEIASPPKLGAAAVVDAGAGKIRVTPAKDQTEPVEFSVVAFDGEKRSAPQVQRVEIRGTNDAPRTQIVSLSTPEDEPLRANFTAVDVDGDALTFKVEKAPMMGKLLLVDPRTGAFTYTPENNRTGEDLLRFSVSDGLLSTPGYIKVKVVPVNDAPVAMPGRIVSAARNGRVVAKLEGYDPEGGKIRYRMRDKPFGLKIELLDENTGDFAVTTKDWQDERATFTFEVVDAEGLVSQPMTVNIQQRR